MHLYINLIMILFFRCTITYWW